MRMRGLLLLAPLAALAQPAAAAGWYADVSGAFSILERTDVDDGRLPGGRGELSADDGFGVAGALGFSYGNGVRSEVELAYRRNNLDDVQTGAFGAVFGGDVDGHVSAFTGMVNVFYDYTTGSPLSPYIGAGIGAAQISVESDRLAADDYDLVFAYQFMGGLRYALTSSVAVRMGYRFVGAPSAEIQGSDIGYFSHNVEAGLTFSF